MNHYASHSAGWGNVRGPRAASVHRGFSLILLMALCLMSVSAHAASLRGSRSSVNRQARVARQHDFTYLRNTAQVKKFLRQGLLVRLPGNAHYAVKGASFSCARPEMKLFIERLSRQYHAATGEKLVVTSLTRPLSRQPRNASQKSVHPTGMAADIRRSHSRKARRWLEKTLLTLEERGVVEATLERHPWHYHVAVFPNQYAAYVDRKLNRGTKHVVSNPQPTLPAGDQNADYVTYRVQDGDTLWTIAQMHRTSVARLKRINAIQSPRIYPGQKLMVPVR